MPEETGMAVTKENVPNIYRISIFAFATVRSIEQTSRLVRQGELQ
jgi:hypothetical protein